MLIEHAHEHTVSILKEREIFHWTYSSDRTHWACSWAYSEYVYVSNWIMLIWAHSLSMLLSTFRTRLCDMLYPIESCSSERTYWVCSRAHSEYVYVTCYIQLNHAHLSALTEYALEHIQSTSMWHVISNRIMLIWLHFLSMLLSTFRVRLCDRLYLIESCSSEYTHWACSWAYSEYVYKIRNSDILLFFTLQTSRQLF